MDYKHNHLVIMAGGVGSRFWPMSTDEMPKQFLDILGTGRTLLQATWDRFKPICSIENVWILTNKAYFDVVRQQLSDIPTSHILLEPCRRNTAPCIAYAAWRIKSLNPHANMIVTPSDHLVTNIAEFQRVIASCAEFVHESDAMITLGMKPNRPETGYGYIQVDLSANSLRNKEIFRVDSFREKPDLATAESYISQKNYLWNAGIFIWNVSTIVNAFRVYQPAMAKIFEGMMHVYGTEKEQQTIDEHYSECENISVDYAIMEKSEDMFVFPAEFGWSDLGTWRSLLTHTKHDLYGNSLIGNDIRVYEASNCIVHTTQAKKVVIQGLTDCIVAENNGVLLICKLSEEQRIKQFVEGD